MDSSKFKKVDSGNYRKKKKATNKDYYKKSDYNKSNYKKNNNYKKHNYKKSDNYAKGNHNKPKKNKSNNYKKNRYYNKNNNYRNNQYYNSNNQNDNVRTIKDDYIYSTRAQKKENRSWINLKTIGILVLIILLIGIGFVAINSMGQISVSTLPSNAVIIYPTQFDYKPDGFYFDTSLHGFVIAGDGNATQSAYYLTEDQILALAYYSNNTFDYSKGIYVTYKTESAIYNDVNVVTHMYFEDGTEMKIPDDYDSSYFIKNSIKIGSNSNYCTKSFGYSGDDYYKNSN